VCCVCALVFPEFFSPSTFLPARFVFCNLKNFAACCVDFVTSCWHCCETLSQTLRRRNALHCKSWGGNCSWQMGKFSFSLRWGSGFLWRTHTHTFAVCNFPLPRELEKPAGEFFALPCVVELCVRQKLLKSLTEGIYTYGGERPTEEKQKEQKFWRRNLESNSASYFPRASLSLTIFSPLRAFSLH